MTATKLTSHHGASNAGRLTNLSGTIATGAVSQSIQDENDYRRYFFFQNISTDVLWVDFGSTAVQDQPAIKIPPDGVLAYEGSYVPTDAVHVIGPNAGAKFVCKVG